MFDFGSSSKGDAQAVFDAISRALAIIEFEPTGKIIWANDNFCKAMGYDLAEIKGQHHSMFCEKELVQSQEYKDFWAQLGRGQFDAREYKRLGKGGREIWIQASYNPVVNGKGVVVKVVKVATDITAAKLKNAEFEAKFEALSRVQAVIEFTPAGEILTANENFLDTLGYRLDEVKGRHHRMFVETSYGQSKEYEDFWKQLNRGEYIATSFKRIGKGGKDVWIQASYNPIFDLNRRVIKVVKYATDITDLTEIGAGLARFADGAIDQPIKREFLPAFEKLKVDFNAAQEKLRSTLAGIAESAKVLDAGAGEVTTASDDLSRRTEQQAASLEETAAALDQITATVKKSAEGASHAREVVVTANEDAKKSSSVVSEAVQAMGAIAKSAQQISQIIGVIDEIAFQTNLLALNAGVEAARAGDAGRGFAVVASEVRALAQRSAEAAKEIKGLISASSTQVDQGVNLVAETGKSLERIIAQVTEINEVVATIAAGANEQATGLHQVNTAINEMDQVTQKNAAMVEETTAAAHSLSQETAQLARLVGQFKIGQSDALKRELQKAAPHVFRSPAKAPPGRASAEAIAKPVDKTPPARAVLKARVVGGGAKVADDTDWQEF